MACGEGEGEEEGKKAKAEQKLIKGLEVVETETRKEEREKRAEERNRIAAREANETRLRIELEKETWARTELKKAPKKQKKKQLTELQRVAMEVVGDIGIVIGDCEERGDVKGAREWRDTLGPRAPLDDEP